MTASEGRARSPIIILLLLLALLLIGVALCEQFSSELLAKSDAQDGLDPGLAPLARLANGYLGLREAALSNLGFLILIAALGPPLVYLGLRRLSRAAHAARERLAGMAFDTPSYHLENPFSKSGDPIAAAQDAFVDALYPAKGDPPCPTDSVLLGFDDQSQPVRLSDRARSMHTHIMGQTGSGKTQSVLYPMMFQDARRGRPLVFLDAKGSADNEDVLASIAAATGRLSDLKLLTLNPGRKTHTYNPLHMTAGADPRQVAERVFSTFEPDLDVQYYKDMARELWVNLVWAAAATGKPFTMLDMAAAIAVPKIMAELLAQSSDKKAVRSIQARYDQLGDRQGQTYTGLLAAINRYDHPALNVTDPDIVLEDCLERGGIVGFSLPANAYKFQARAIGMIVLQHIQHIGAQRQMDRSRSQAPASVFADEFSTFAYDGFIDAVNKLRDAHISLTLSHQSLSDLERVSKEFATGIWDNPRNKIVLYQSDPALCERLAQSLGTKKNVELTVRRSVDGYLNQASMLEASSREVDQFILHPSRVKNLGVGQCYLAQQGTYDGGLGGAGGASGRRHWWKRARQAENGVRVTGVNLPLFPGLPAAAPPEPMKRLPMKARRDDQGIGLHRLFVTDNDHD